MWLVWPRDPMTWPDRVDRARAAYVQAMQAIAPQRVDLVVHPDHLIEAQAATQGMPHVHLHAIEHQDSWIRDYGPLTLVHADQQKMLKFRFDAWGEKYESLIADDGVVPRLVGAGAMPAMDTIDFVLEGGAVETDGKGTFLATRSVAEGRNQHVEDVEDVLREHLRAKHVIWLDEGIEGDDTDGHIDTIARFVAPRTVVAAMAPPDHPDHAALADNLATLRHACDAAGKPLKVQTLPVPPQMVTDDGVVLPAGYANFLITNHAVLLPSYGDAADAQAASMLAPHFPGRSIARIDHRDLIWGMGGIHCLSMQVPQ